MKRKILYWTPRILSILYALFLSMFALDVFQPNVPLGQIIIALFMHLLPTFVIIVCILIAWRYEELGSILFMILGVYYIIMTSNSRFNFITYLIIVGPVVLISIFFMINATIKNRHRDIKEELEKELEEIKKKIKVKKSSKKTTKAKKKKVKRKTKKKR